MSIFLAIVNSLIRVKGALRIHGNLQLTTDTAVAFYIAFMSIDGWNLNFFNFYDRVALFACKNFFFEKFCGNFSCVYWMVLSNNSDFNKKNLMTYSGIFFIFHFNFFLIFLSMSWVFLVQKIKKFNRVCHEIFFAQNNSHEKYEISIFVFHSMEFQDCLIIGHYTNSNRMLGARCVHFVTRTLY